MKDKVPQNTWNLWAVCVETGKVPGSKVQVHHLSVGYSVLSFRPCIFGCGGPLRARERALDITVSAAGLTSAKERQVLDVINTRSISGARGSLGVRCKIHEAEMAIVIRSLRSLHNGEVISACLNPPPPRPRPEKT